MSKSLSTNKLKIENKSNICAITLILVLAASSFAILLPRVDAATGTGPTGTGITVPQWAYINAFPSPIGVSQTISIFAWTANISPTANRNTVLMDKLTIIVTLPDGTTTTLALRIGSSGHNLHHICSIRNRQLHIPICRSRTSAIKQS